MVEKLISWKGSSDGHAKGRKQYYFVEFGDETNVSISGDEANVSISVKVYHTKEEKSDPVARQCNL